MPLCRSCKHFRPFVPIWAFFVPVIGQIALLVMSFDWDDRYRLGKCAVSFYTDEDPAVKWLGTKPKRPKMKFAAHSREYGPCRPSGDLYEAK